MDNYKPKLSTNKAFQEIKERLYAAYGGKDKYEEAMKGKLPCAPRITGKNLIELTKDLRKNAKFRADSLTRSGHKVII